MASTLRNFASPIPVGGYVAGTAEMGLHRGTCCSSLYETQIVENVSALFIPYCNFR